MHKSPSIPLSALAACTAAILLSGCSEQVEQPVEKTTPPETITEAPKPLPAAEPKPVAPEIPLQPLETTDTTEPPITLYPRAGKNYSYAYWLNGWRKNKDDGSDDILCFETGYFGLMLDLSDFKNCRFQRLDDQTDYLHALRADTRRISNLVPAELLIEATVNGKVYRAVTCKAGTDDGNVKKLRNARLWESGQLAQHFDLLGLVFEDGNGQQLPCDATLDIVIWPDALTFNLILAPEDTTWADASINMSLNDWTAGRNVSNAWKPGTEEHLTLTCSVNGRDRSADAISIKLSTDEKQEFQSAFDEAHNCHKIEIGKRALERKWETGYTDIREYDDFDLTINNHAENTYIPFLLDLSGPANITGLCPMLCNEDGTPTGIPVQLSKNWHHEELGAYLRAYALIPAAKGTTRYKLRIAYGFYGTLPSASHSQLSLVGYGRSEENGNNGRWDQLAIGCWGETICYDVDMSCVDNMITDVRMLMTRNGLQGKKWSWTDGGWGGDWLNLRDSNDQKLYPTELKTAYSSQGPCLTEVHYDGFYGSKREVDFKTTVRTLRTDDYARTFHTFNYTFKKSVSAENGWLFKMGKTPRLVVPRIAYGNKSGLIKEHNVPDGLKFEETYKKNTELTGSAPWWIAFPGSYKEEDRDWGTGCRGLVIRSYEARINGKTYTTPTISFPVYRNIAPDKINLDMILTPPEGIKEFSPGDHITFDLEWITLPREADDYYGPNETFRNHLSKYPRSWKSVYREALGNNLQIQTAGGMVKNTYPIIIEATRPDDIQIKIAGGVGVVPIRFEGLQSPNFSLYQVKGSERIKLDQSVHGNDFWQTGYDPESNTYSLTYNLPLDGLKTSGWILKAE